MSDPEDQNQETYDERCERLRGLPLDSAVGLLDELTTAYQDVETRYSGPFSQFRQNLSPEDLAALNAMVGDLLPLSMNDEVHAQMLAAGSPVDDGNVVLHRINFLNMNISMFMSRFKNSGVTRIS